MADELKAAPGMRFTEDRTQPTESICLWTSGRDDPYIFYRPEVKNIRDWMTRWLEEADKAYEKLGPDDL